MSAIRSIISTHRARLEASGLMRQVNPGPLPEHIQRIASPHFRALAVLRECPERLQVQASPLAILFEHTLPKLEPLLMEIGEGRAKKIVDRLCEHGKQIMEQMGSEGSQKYLEKLFQDLPGLESELRKKDGLEKMIAAYRALHLEGKTEIYLKFILGRRMKECKVDEQGGLDLTMSSGATVRDLEKLRGLKKIAILRFPKTMIVDFSPLAGLPDLRVLDIMNCPLSDLSVLSGLTGLTKLRVAGARISDLSPLSGLPGLKVLILSSNTISDLSPLSALTGLQVLGLESNQIVDLKPLAELTGLQELLLDGNLVENLWPLANLTGLSTLSLNSTYVNNINPIKRLTGLKVLELLSTPISERSILELKRTIPGLKVIP